VLNQSPAGGVGTGTGITGTATGKNADIDLLLFALADPTRRSIVERLSRGPASVTTLAAPLPMSLPAVVQHLQVLERTGLVVSEKQGRVRTCRLDPAGLAKIDDWLNARRASWERALDRLGEVLDSPDASGGPGTTYPKGNEQ
jgi:DNA-binding transcriptional ArsR family regulator